MYETLAGAFELRVVWVHPPPSDEPVPAALQMEWTVVHDDPRILTPADLRRNAALFRRVIRAGRGADLIVASTSDSWKARVVYAAARACGVPIALRKEKWRDRTTELGGVKRLYWRWQLGITDYMERHAVGMLVGGTKSAEYLVGRGLPTARIEPFRYLHPDLSAQPVDHQIVERLRRIKGERIAFLYLGRAIHRKGLVPLVRAFRSVLATGRDAVLFVVGEAIAEDTGRGAVSTEYVSEARRLAQDEPRVVFLGRASPGEVNSYYAASDVFVHPHVASVDGKDVHEGWGQVITEAACMGKAIVTTDRVASGFDVVIPGETGFLISAERIDDELAATMRQFIDRPDLAAELGRAARRRFDAFVDPDLNVVALRRLIERGGRS